MKAPAYSSRTKTCEMIMERSSSGKGLRLVICSPGVPHEARGASAVLFFHYINGLKRAGFEILNILLLQSGEYTEASLSEYVARMAEPGKVEIKPCRAARFDAPRCFSLKLNSAVLAEVVGQAEKFEAHAVLGFDLLSVRVAEQITGGAKLAWLGDLNFQTFWYHAWYAAKENPLHVLNLPIVWFRSLLWKKIYKDALQRMDLVIVSSKSSEDHLAQLGIPSLYLPYPWPNEAAPKETAQTQHYLTPSFLFYGTLTGLGSRSALHFMIRRLYPRLLSLWGSNGFQVFIAGARNLPDWVRDELSRKPEFKYLGFVNDLDSLMSSCHAVICPMDVPVGNRSRIVTAMAKRAVVIAHPHTALGNPDLVHENTCYLPATIDGFVEYMKKAFERPREIEVITSNAQRCYETRFRPDVAVDMMVEQVLFVLQPAVTPVTGIPS